MIRFLNDKFILISGAIILIAIWGGWYLFESFFGGIYILRYSTSDQYRYFFLEPSIWFILAYFGVAMVAWSIKSYQTSQPSLVLYRGLAGSVIWGLYAYWVFLMIPCYNLLCGLAVLVIMNIAAGGVVVSFLAKLIVKYLLNKRSNPADL